MRGKGEREDSTDFGLDGGERRWVAKDETFMMVVPSPSAKIEPSMPNFDGVAERRVQFPCIWCFASTLYRNDNLITAMVLHLSFPKKGNCLDFLLPRFSWICGNTVSFVTSIPGYLWFQQFVEAVELFSMLHWEPIWLYFDFESSCQYGVGSSGEGFGRIACKDRVIWTGMVASYTESDFFEEALELFLQMRVAGFEPDNFTFSVDCCLEASL
ncbi:hypothetical protein SLEP1_g6544 [Rubroshorea leprosula]|uniref:Pentatricopeptide repeat-containing protein n=1 Tax=Rubroshorea leprosula TaxID=152421 RepID=A0AAV5I6G6_9ROSI|nr:hypothetical protein SLEP1_g6544 [Rubroshorea leprosula]